jgi:hypothetical protein
MHEDEVKEEDSHRDKKVDPFQKGGPEFRKFALWKSFDPILYG